MIPSETDFPFVLRRKQFPIRPAFCITINKGQGQSLNSVGIFLPSPDAIFSHGQLYVALSRVQNPRGLKLLVGGVFVKNVVYRKVFQYHLGNIGQYIHNTSNDSHSSNEVDYISDDTEPTSIYPVCQDRMTVFQAESVNNFSLAMRINLAISIDMSRELIIPERSIGVDHAGAAGACPGMKESSGAATVPPRHKSAEFL